MASGFEKANENRRIRERVRDGTAGLPPRVALPRTSGGARRRQMATRDRLNGDEIQELWLGPSHNGSVFASRAELEAAWIAGRERVMALYGSRGRRPMAWWQFSAPPGLDYPGYDVERSVLYNLGLLGEAEKAGLESYWKEQFDRANAPNFALCLGSAGWLHGEEARRAHHQWADIPAALVEAWTAADRPYNPPESPPESPPRRFRRRGVVRPLPGFNQSV
jgi:hypothetical protein